MSYDIYLRDPVTGETAEVPGHLMVDGTFRADYHPETSTLTPALNTEAHLNITYNYGSYYYEATNEKGIRSIYERPIRCDYERVAGRKEENHCGQI